MNDKVIIHAGTFGGSILLFSAIGECFGHAYVGAIFGFLIWLWLVITDLLFGNKK